MTAKNHFLFSISAASLTLATVDPFVLLIAGAMSLLPDIDSSKSVYGKILFPLSRLIERHFPHRTFTHSFFMTAIVAIGAIPLAFESKEFYFAAWIINQDTPLDWEDRETACRQICDALCALRELRSQSEMQP